MFAPRIARAQTKVTARPVKLLVHSRSAPLAYARKAAVDPDAPATPSRSWDFTKISIFPYDRPNRSQISFPLSTPSSPIVHWPKLVVGRVDDAVEHEAERVAKQVAAPQTHPEVGSAPTHIGRFFGQPSEATDTAPSSVEQALAGPGRPLEPALRQHFEQRFGYDFSRVRVHSDAASGISARQLQTNAYTAGYDIVVDSGHLAPATSAGQRLLAHELTHVVQQTRGNHASQVKVIQRDPPKSGDLAKEQEEALINFKDDWNNNFSHYDKLIKISGRTYDHNQKEGIKAVKDGNSIKIVLGKPYFTETDDETRWQWVKRKL